LFYLDTKNPQIPVKKAAAGAGPERLLPTCCWFKLLSQWFVQVQGNLCPFVFLGVASKRFIGRARFACLGVVVFLFLRRENTGVLIGKMGKKQ
jgi:hypothetical protein